VFQEPQRVVCQPDGALPLSCRTMRHTDLSIPDVTHKALSERDHLVNWCDPTGSRNAGSHKMRFESKRELSGSSRWTAAFVQVLVRGRRTERRFFVVLRADGPWSRAKGSGSCSPKRLPACDPAQNS
jgi:hypothetical protein